MSNYSRNIINENITNKDKWKSSQDAQEIEGATKLL